MSRNLAGFGARRNERAGSARPCRARPRRPRLTAVAFLALAGAGLPAPPADGAQAASGATLEQGKKIYRANCLECHGKSGRGDGERALRLGFKTRDFTLGSFKCRCTPSGALPSDEDLLRVVARGLPGTPMKGFADVLSDDERRSLVEYVKSLAPVFAERPAPPCLEIPAPAMVSDATLAEGKQVYRLLRCWTCHGTGGRGDGPAAKTLLDDYGARVRVHNFTRPGRFKCGGENRDLYRLLHTGLSGSPMPSYSTALLFSSAVADSVDSLADTFGANEIEDLKNYLARQPDDESLQAMADTDRRDLADRRAWGLVHYLLSLVEP